MFALLLLFLSSLSVRAIENHYRNLNSIYRTDSTNEASNVAVIVAKPTYHEEVVGPVVCALNSLGLTTVVYIGNGYSVHGHTVPFTGLRERSSSALYGKCVSKFVTITTNMELIKNPKIVVFASPPTHNPGELFDIEDDAKLLLSAIYPQQGGIAVDRANGPNVAIIWHNAKPVVTDDKNLEVIKQYVPISKLVYLMLGRHVHNTLLEYTNEFTKTKELPAMNYIYPVHDLDYAMRKSMRDAAFSKIEASMKSRDILLYASLESNFQSERVELTSHVMERLHSRTYNKDMTIFSLQGNFGGKHSFRRDPSATFSCLQSIVHTTILSDENIVTSRDNQMNCPLMLRLIGKIQPPIHDVIKPTVNAYGRNRFIANPVNLTQQQLVSLQKNQQCHLHVTGLHNSPYNQFYEALQQSDFIIGGINSESYFTTKATSSVPTALMVGVPFVANKAFISLYPCIGDANSAHLRYIARETECESIQAAYQVTDKQYLELKNEIKRCSVELWTHTTNVFAKYM